MGILSAQLLDDGELAYVPGARALTVASIGGETVVYTAGGTGGGLTAFLAGADGSLSLLDQRAIAEPFQVGATPSLSVGAGPDGPVLLVSGLEADGTGVMALQPDGRFAAPEDLSGVSGALIAPLQVSVGGADYVYSGEAGGLAGFELLGDGLAGAVPGVADTSDLKLYAVSALGFGSVAGNDFLFAASFTENAVTSLQIGADGRLEPSGWVGAADGLGMAAPSALAFAEIGGNAYLIVASDGALSVLTVASDGTLDVADHVIDGLATRFGGITAMATAEADGHLFVVAGGSDDGLSLFTVTQDGRLVHLASLADSNDASLQNIAALGLFVAGGQLQITALSGAEAGLGRLTWDLAQLGDVVTGDAADNALAGGAGNDIVIDGDGNDTLTGGAGADLFVLSRDGRADTVLDFELGIDRIDLSEQWLLYGVGQLDITATATGAEIRYGGELLVLNRAGGGSITEADLTDAMILNADRPPFFTADQTKTGGAGNDRLTGGLGNDQGDGGAGSDVLDGRAGADVLRGGTGEDTIFGHDGDDTLYGDAGYDLLYGGAGADTILGGAQADVVYGGAGADVIDGGDGLDTLFGGDGADTLSGGAGDDVIRGGDGADLVDGEDGDDRIWGEFGDDSLYGGDGADALTGGWDDDILRGGLQNDALYGDIGDDLLLGDAGLDRLFGGGGNDRLNGGGQGDLILGGPGNDRLIGEGGRDRLEGGDGGDWLNGGSGGDVLLGEAGDDRIEAGIGNDRLLGGTGDDRMFGGDGNDTLLGGAGFDLLRGGAGDDLLTGNFNADVFVFTDGFGQDRVTDFEALNDFEMLDLRGVAAITDFADLVADHMVQSGADVLIDAGGGNSITLEGVLLANLDAADFLF
ncbi:MAG: hypothetical protein HKN63_08290 [Rhodobacteraceae bacterium]|nr:hypothetical protein [Paracoccaceae bacterium]